MYRRPSRGQDVQCDTDEVENALDIHQRDLLDVAICDLSHRRDCVGEDVATKLGIVIFGWEGS